jgi:hypothetical protein
MEGKWGRLAEWRTKDINPSTAHPSFPPTRCCLVAPSALCPPAALRAARRAEAKEDGKRTTPLHTRDSKWGGGSKQQRATITAPQIQAESNNMHPLPCCVHRRARARSAPGDGRQRQPATEDARMAAAQRKRGEYARCCHSVLPLLALVSCAACPPLLCSALPCPAAAAAAVAGQAQ